MRFDTKRESLKEAYYMDEAAYKQLYEENAESLRNYLFYKCGDLAEAKDLMQESFLRLWQNRDRVEKDKALPYLYTIANRLFLDQKRHEKVVLKFQQRQRHSVEHEDPQYLAELKEFQALLEAKLAAMPEKWRTVFLMNRIEKITYREIAVKLGLSTKAVEKRMHNALKYLQDIYKK